MFSHNLSCRFRMNKPVINNEVPVIMAIRQWKICNEDNFAYLVNIFNRDQPKKIIKIYKIIQKRDG